MSEPLFPEIGVIALVPDHWGGPWQPRHQIMSRLSRYFQVLWYDPPRGWREAWLGKGRERSVRNEAPAWSRMVVCDPGKTWPKVFKPAFVGRAFERLRVNALRRELRRRGCTKTVVYVWRPEFGPLLDHVPHDLSCYHIDDEYSFSASDVPTPPAERALIERVDHVFIHSPGLLEKKGNINPSTTVVPNGVDYELYATPSDEPDDLKEIPRPRIGYTGMVKDKLDFPLQLELANRHPQWSFVFVGPLQKFKRFEAELSAMQALPNVHFLGEKPFDALAAYARGFDVCSMPYFLDDYTKYIYPLKLHEYLATGRPVIGAPILSLREFGDVVRLVSTVDEWSRGIEELLGAAENTPDRGAERQAVAKAHDWNVYAERVSRIFCDSLGLNPARSLSEVLSEAKVS